MRQRESRDQPSHWLDAILSAVFPSHCALCRAFVPRNRDRSICPSCWARIPQVPQPFCRRCGLPLPGHGSSNCGSCTTQPPSFSTARAFGLYQQELRELIHLLKFRGREDLAKPLGIRMATVFDPGSPSGQPPMVIPVPLHRRRQRQRGYNQSELLARSAARVLRFPLYPDGLKRKRETLPQSGLTDRQRMENVQAAFEIGSGLPVQGRQILLVDDILTTGATLNACARVLLASGAAGVDVLTLARVPHLP